MADSTEAGGVGLRTYDPSIGAATRGPAGSALDRQLALNRRSLGCGGATSLSSV